MKQELYNHFSEWWRNFALHSEEYYLILSDDMDSFYSCKYLSKRFGAEIGGFYKFGKGLYLTDAALMNEKQLVYVDCACAKDGVMCFDNHRTLLSNHMAINPNLILDRTDDSNYYKKYCGSTLMMIYALYHGELTELEKEMILAIDGFYIGWYKNDGFYRKVNQFWLDELEIADIFTPVLENKSMNYFTSIVSKYQLMEKIYVDRGKLFTYADILPHDRFNLVLSTETRRISKKDIMNMSLINKDLFTAAETFDGSYSADFIIS